MRFLQTIIGCAFLLILLSGCGEPPPTLKPEEVLRRTVIAGSMLDSLSLLGSGALKLEKDGRTSAVITDVNGVIHGGSVWSFDVRGIMNKIAATGSGNRINGTLSSPGDGSIYLRLSSFSGPDAPLVQRLLSGSTATQWWLVAGDPSGMRSTAVTTPAAQDIGTFVSSFRVLEDFGMIEEDGRKMYRYKVDVVPPHGGAAEEDPMKISGEIRIDAESYFLIRAVWQLANVPTIAGSLSGNISLTLRDQNKAQDAAFPPGAAARFPLQEFLQILF